PPGQTIICESPEGEGLVHVVNAVSPIEPTGDAESEMREPRAVDRASSFQSDRERARVLEQAPAFTAKDGRQVDPYFVKKTGPHDLLSGVRAAHSDVLATRGRPCLPESVFDAVGDEGERRSSRPPGRSPISNHRLPTTTAPVIL